MPETNEGTPRVSEGDENARPSDVTDDGIVTGTGGTDTTVTANEAAFASSYIEKMSLNVKKICWGLGKERDSANRPIDAVNAEKKYASLGGKFLANDGRICLTFDEGYENGYTAQILDTLKEKGVKAIFFVTYDYCRTAPELVERMIAEGHVVGNHTWSHPSMPDITQKEVWAEVTKLHEYVHDEFGYDMSLFRFPKGEFSEQTLEDVQHLGYTSLFWSFAYADWDPNAQTDPAETLAKIEDSTHSGIYLLHAVSPTNAKLLAPLIDFWRDKGYTVGAEW
ncbi:MAG: polysaccharide deacetylase family protein [Ruminiclostridium sp.]|nr:polysaccharide deacetylase family protein [Ruminiclostridium sp.]